MFELCTQGLLLVVVEQAPPPSTQSAGREAHLSTSSAAVLYKGIYRMGLAVGERIPTVTVCLLPKGLEEEQEGVSCYATGRHSCLQLVRSFIFQIIMNIYSCVQQTGIFCSYLVQLYYCKLP